ncbi:MAG: hypothetical protein UD936_06155 [Acutalibacteraceae bacterium]|nr:hypothetical protein [Acutalibacteraceae bacterium]
MSTKKERPGFFKLYFKNFKSMLVGNVLFSIPLVIASALVYLLAKALDQATNVWFLALVIILIYPFYSGVTQITKDVVKGGKEAINPLKAFKKGIKNNVKYFALYGVLIYLAVIISYYSISLYISFASKSLIFLVPAFIAILISLFLLFMSFSLPILTVTLELKLKHYFKNAALMAFGEILMNVYVAVTTFVLLSACVSLSLYTGNPIAGVIVLIVSALLILPTGISYCAVYRLYPKMEKLFKLEPKEEVKSFPTMPVPVPTDDEGNPIKPDISDDSEGYVFVNGRMIKKSLVNNNTEYIDEND